MEFTSLTHDQHSPFLHYHIEGIFNFQEQNTEVLFYGSIGQ